jgi:antitoxin MazE
MRVHLVKIGNSRGVRLPRAVIEEAELGEDITLTVRKGVVTLRAARPVRAGWAEAAKECHEAGEDALILGDLKNDFDESW